MIVAADREHCVTQISCAVHCKYIKAMRAPQTEMVWGFHLAQISWYNPVDAG